LLKIDAMAVQSSSMQRVLPVMFLVVTAAQMGIADGTDDAKTVSRAFIKRAVQRGQEDEHGGGRRIIGGIKATGEYEWVTKITWVSSLWT